MLTEYTLPLPAEEFLAAALADLHKHVGKHGPAFDSTLHESIEKVTAALEEIKSVGQTRIKSMHLNGQWNGYLFLGGQMLTFNDASNIAYGVKIQPRGNPNVKAAF